MDSITTAGGLASEKLQSVPSAASPKPTETCVPAAEGLLQPMQHRENREAVMTHHLAKLDVALDSPEAADAGGQAESTEDECSPTNDIKDDVSIDSAVLVAERRWLLDGQLDGAKEEHDPTIAWALGPDKRKGTKYARVAAIYTESLEYRVSALETELLKLQYEIGSKERPGEERQVMRSIFNLNEYRVLVLILVSCRDDDTPTPNSPCADPVPLKVMLLSMKDWKNGRHHAKWDKAPIFLATTTERPSVQLETTHPDTHSQGPDHDKGVTYYKDDLVADVRRPGLSDVARLMFASPWPLILIELLSGEHINTGETWIYPFKHIVVYEKQIRKFLELLNETNVDDLEVNNLSHTLNMIISKVVRDLGPKRDDVEYSEAYVSIILQTWRHELKNHHLRVRQSSPEDQEKELEEDTKAEPGLSSISSTDGTCTKVSEPSNLAPEAYPVQEAIPYMCTCLKDARDHMQLLVNMIDSHLGSLLTLHEAVRDRAISKIRFEHLWHLFQPGDLVVTSKQPHQAYRVIHVSGGRPLLMTTDIASGDQDAKAKPPFRRQAQVSPFNIDCVRIDFDGEKFGPVQETFRIFEYEEDRVITRLELYPMSYAEFPEGLAQTLLDRGRRFAEYRLFKHKRYEGLSLSEPQEEMESEVIVDFTQSFRQPDYAKHKPQIGLQGATRADEREIYEDRCTLDEGLCLRNDHNALVDDTIFDKLQMDRFLNVESHGMFLESRGESQILNEDQMVLLPFRVHGFSLRSRKWLPLDIDLLQDVKENDTLDRQGSGFDDLVIPDEYKRIVKALVKSHALGSRRVENKDRDKQQIDLIRGKGKGLIILLHGVPGVGKTSTAESVASYTGRPLFPITCGDIGQTAFDVERNLEAIFHLARKWGCVLLLDEADVFLAKRERGGDGIDRNALVSVFLRTLEYYSGILFLTTNRIGSFDEAFKSRIHISLYYAPLSESQTLEVWAMNLNRLSKSNRDIYVDKSEIEAFARSHWKDGKRWNGRQIRNAFQTAIALAEYEFQERCQKCEKTGDKPPFRPALEDRQFKAVARTSAEFDDYLQSVMHGQTHEQKALISEMRNDTYDHERGIDTPSGKKHSYQRAVRPSRESDAFTKQTVTPPATPQLLSAASVGSGAPMDDAEEYRQFKAGLEEQKQAEKMERFRKMHEMEQMGK